MHGVSAMWLTGSASSSSTSMSSPAQRLAELGLAANKRLGQHFLHDRAIVRRICDVAEIRPDATVVEIGPGLGILTEELTRRAGCVIALEKDETLARALANLELPSLQIRNADALQVSTATLTDEPYQIVANLPYNVATAILRHFLDAQQPPTSCTFMVQREVAERMVARPPDMNVLAVAMQFHGSPRIAFNVGRGAFTPPPRVTSAIVHMPVERRPGLESADIDQLFRIVRAGFSARRKTLRNSLMIGGLEESCVNRMLTETGTDGKVRAQTLDISDWIALANAANNAERQCRH